MTLITNAYYNRDLSWLRFNHRVLQEAADVKTPLYERIKFLAIFSSNLDEFYRVRVSAIRQIKELEKPLRKKLISKPNKLLTEINNQVDILQKEFGRIFYSEIIPSLRRENITLLLFGQYSKGQLEFCKKYYKENLTDLCELVKEEDVLLVENEVIYLIGGTNSGKLIWVKIKPETSRFITIPDTNDGFNILFIDDILKYNLKEHFKIDFYAVKISRDAELYIKSEYSGNLLDKIKAALPNRNSGQVTRALIDKKMPKKIIDAIKKALDINDTDIVKGGTYHNFKDFFGFPNPSERRLIYEELKPIPNKLLRNRTSLLDAIDEKDRLLCFPYESFDDVVRLVEEAASDKNVIKIKATLYRVSRDSLIAKALLLAAKNGKKVYVFIETKARFDEENNIKWGKTLEDNGAIVKYSYPGIKVHSKILYIEKKVGGESKGYSYIGTGNFNEKTSKVYTDFGLMTAHKKIVSEILQVFQVLEGKLIIPKCKKLLVSPFTTRKRLIDLIEVEIENARRGIEAYIILKINSLQDIAMINLLYKASNAGVKMKLIVRGICCLVPQIKGQSENIHVTSIVDRFLEHGRVYLFANRGNEKMFIGSADWMSRNLDHRIEVITPILDKEVFAKISKIVQHQLNDTTKSRYIDAEQTNQILTDKETKPSSQHLIYEELKLTNQ